MHQATVGPALPGYLGADVVRYRESVRSAIVHITPRTQTYQVPRTDVALWCARLPGDHTWDRQGLHDAKLVEADPYTEAQYVLEHIRDSNAASKINDADIKALMVLLSTGKWPPGVVTGVLRCWLAEPGRQSLRDSPAADKTLVRMMEVCMSQLQPGSRPDILFVNTAHALVLVFQ